MKATKKQLPTFKFKARHHLIGSQTFDTWQDLCDAAIEAGEKQAKKDLEAALKSLMFLYSDAIIMSAEETISGGD